MEIWVALAATILIQVLAGTAFLVNLKNQYDELARRSSDERKSALERHDQLIGKSAMLEAGLLSLREAFAVAASERKDGYRRLEIVEKQVDENIESMRQLRNRVHDIAGVVQRIDPAWNPYRSEK